jgi:hypothetical protein
MPPTGESAYFRARHPNSWWWTPDTDFLAALLCAIQGGNWQRGGGKGPQPEQLKRPRDDTAPDTTGQLPTTEQLTNQREAMRAELARRRAHKRGA